LAEHEGLVLKQLLRIVQERSELLREVGAIGPSQDLMRGIWAMFDGRQAPPAVKPRIELVSSGTAGEKSEIICPCGEWSPCETRCDGQKTG
jgi:hypothetical protein